MTRALLLGGILGGVLVFAWGAVSWMALPWHEATLKRFSNEDVVAVTLDAFAPDPGVYFLAPGMDDEGKPVTDEEPGRVIFAAIQPPMPAMNPAMLKGLISTLLAALLVTWLVLQSRLDSFGRRYALVLVFAVATSLVGIVPNWIWWGFATDYTALAIADVLIGWGLGGLVIAWSTGPKR